MKPVEQIVEASDGNDDNDNLEQDAEAHLPARNENNIFLTLRPIDKDWIMGEDWVVELSKDTTMRQIRKYIDDMRGISEHRIQLRLVVGNLVPTNKEAWTIRRMGISDGYIMQVEPTLSGLWTWNNLEYYENKLLADVGKEIDGIRNGVIELNELCKIIPKPPPPIKISLRVFLRKYPEIFHIYTDMTSSLLWISRTKYLMQMPTFSYMPQQMGTIDIFQPKEFDWASYADIDDTKRVELDFDIPEVEYEISIVALADICTSTTLRDIVDIENCDMNSLPVACVGRGGGVAAYVFFNNEFVGHSHVRVSTNNPKWRDARFKVSISSDSDVFHSHLYVELWECVMQADGEFAPATLLGTVSLTGQGLIDLLCDRRQACRDYALSALRSDSQVARAVDVQGMAERVREVTGTVTIKGGKSGYELCVFSARNIMDPQAPGSKPFCAVYWNSEEVFVTLPVQNDVNDPIFNEIITIPPLAFGKTFNECTLEVQIWGTASPAAVAEATAAAAAPVTDEGAPTAKVQPVPNIFLGSAILKGDPLIRLLTGNVPWASKNTRVDLAKSSLNVPLKQRKNEVRGYACLSGGLAGLMQRPGQIVELVVLTGNKLARLGQVYFTVDWNSVQVGRSGAITLQENIDPANSKSKMAVFGHKFRLEYFEAMTSCELCIELFEQPTGALASGNATYLGRVLIDGSGLVELFGQEYAVIQTYTFEPHPVMDEKLQRLIRGDLTLRGGVVNARAEVERSVMIQRCIDIVEDSLTVPGTNHHDARHSSSSAADSISLFQFCRAEVSWHGALVGGTDVMPINVDIATWSDQSFYLVKPPPPPLPPPPKNKNAKPVEPPGPYACYDKVMLVVDVFAEASAVRTAVTPPPAPAATGLSLLKHAAPLAPITSALIGRMKLEGQELIDFIESDEFVEKSFPLFSVPDSGGGIFFKHTTAVHQTGLLVLSSCGVRHVSPCEQQLLWEQAVLAEAAARVQRSADALAEIALEKEKSLARAQAIADAAAAKKNKLLVPENSHESQAHSDDKLAAAAEHHAVTTIHNESDIEISTAHLDTQEAGSTPLDQESLAAATEQIIQEEEQEQEQEDEDDEVEDENIDEGVQDT